MNIVEAPHPEPPVRMIGFLTGVGLTQIVDSALHLAQPLLLAKISGSMGEAALFSAFDTGVHMLGTYCCGWPLELFGAKRVLVVTTFLRGVALSAIPIGMITGRLTLLWAMAFYTLEALIRGFVDASVHTIPLELAKHRRDQLDLINSRYEILFDGGGIVGPLMLGVLMVCSDKIVPHLLISMGFALSAVAYLFIPHTEKFRSHHKKDLLTENAHKGTWIGIKYIFSNKALLFTCIGVMSFNIYPLRKLLSAFFANGILNNPTTVGQIGAAFAIGGVVGAIIYGHLKQFKSGHTLVIAGAVGTLILSVGWIPANLWVMMAAAFAFALTNVCARLILTRKRQELTPLEHAGGVTSAQQFGVMGISVIVKSILGAAFSIGTGAYGAFAIVGGILALFGVGQLILPRYLTRNA
jgi:hypothetical protein